MEGWVKIHRKMLENPIVCKDSETLSIWLYLLLNATHKDIPALFKGNKITLKKGQLITGTLSISKKLMINKDKVQRTLKCFEVDKQIEQQTSNQNRLITILNWDKYQDDDKQFDKQMINECETNDKQLITNKNVKNDNNILYLNLFNKYKEKVAKIQFWVEKIRLINQMKEENDYLKLTNEEQENIVNDLLTS